MVVSFNWDVYLSQRSLLQEIEGTSQSTTSQIIDGGAVAGGTALAPGADAVVAAVTQSLDPASIADLGSRLETSIGIYQALDESARTLFR